MKAASIDIGTNSVLLLVADISKNDFKVLHEIQEIPRLGEGVDKEKRLGEESRKRVINVLKSYKAYLARHYPELVPHTIVTATSAVRDASNRSSFLESVFVQTGWNIRLLSGDEEAQTTYKGALTVLSTNSDEKYLVLDIGGGSTEIANGIGLSLKNGISIDMGSVRFSERFFLNPKVDIDTVNQVRETVRRNLEPIDAYKKPYTVIGVAGTVTSLAAVAFKLEKYDTDTLNGYTLTKSDVENCIKLFIGKTSGEIEAINPLFLSGRGDVITAGAIILSEFLSWCNSDSLIVSTGGIRHGILS